MPARQHVRAARVASVAALAFVALVVPAAVAGCGAALSPLQSQVIPVAGEGDVATETRTVDAFTHLSAGSGINVVVSEGAPQSVTVSAQRNLLPIVRTEVADGQLVISAKAPGFTTTQPVTVTVLAPRLESMTLSGGSGGELDAAGGDLALDLSGGATLEGRGRADTLHLTGSSGSTANLTGLAAADAVLDLSGGATAHLSVSNAVTGTASGGATVDLGTKPATVDVTTSGGATIRGG